ncbi:MAG: TolC family protein [Pirellulales bacterium]
MSKMLCGLLSAGLLSIAGCNHSLHRSLNPFAPRPAAQSPERIESETAIASSDVQGMTVAAGSLASFVSEPPSQGLSSASIAQTAAPIQLVAEQQPADQESTDWIIDYAPVLQLTDAQNPNVAVARERILEAYARTDRARALWLPSLRTGLNYNHHQGTIQDVAGNVFNTNRSAMYGGFGSGGVGAASPAVPGVVAQFHLSDAISQPRITSHQAASRQFAATATRNDALRDAAIAYWELVRAERLTAIAKQSVAQTTELADILLKSSQAGQGLKADAQRAAVEVMVRRDEALSAEEQRRTCAACLAQLLHAESSSSIATGEEIIVPLAIAAGDQSEADAVASGLMRRPELAEQKHLVCEAAERLRREKLAPLVPSVLLGMSYGSMGGGLGSNITNTGDRFDADAIAYWEVRNLGAGERAARREQASVLRQSQMRKVALLDQVAREITEAYAQVQQREARMANAATAVQIAEESYSLNRQRIENAQGLPIEALQSVAALAASQRLYLNAVIDYNAAQVQLCRAMGWFVEN